MPYRIAFALPRHLRACVRRQSGRFPTTSASRAPAHCDIVSRPSVHFRGRTHLRDLQPTSYRVSSRTYGVRPKRPCMRALYPAMGRSALLRGPSRVALIRSFAPRIAAFYRPRSVETSVRPRSLIGILEAYSRKLPVAWSERFHFAVTVRIPPHGLH